MATSEWVYTDESGTQDPERANYCIVGGYRGTPSQWDTFASGWNAVLTRRGVVGAFHADEYFNRRNWSRRKPNQFVGWDDNDATLLLDGLVKVIAGRRLDALGYALDARDFNALPYWQRCALVAYIPPHLFPASVKRHRIRRPEAWMLAYQVTLNSAVKNASKDAEVHFRIARHEQYGPRAEEHFWALKEALTQGGNPDALKFADIAQRTPESEPAIQAADLLCYLWFRFMQRGGESGLSEIERDAFRTIRGSRDHLLVGDGENFRQMLAQHSAKTIELFGALKPPRGVS